jgi:hypothetical protein
LRVMPARIRRVTADNKLFAAVLVPALLIRVDAELGYRWWVYFNDSFNYISTAATGVTDPVRVSGYGIFLRALRPLHSFALVTILQHVMGMLVAVMIYALAKKRFGAPAWLAVAVTLPVLYDGFEIQLEHQILSDTMFLFIAMVAVTVLLWAPQPSWWRCGLAALLIGVSAIVRSTGLPLIPVFAVYLVIALFPRRRNWRAWRPLVAGLVAFGIATAVPVLGYEALYDHQHGQFAMNASTGVFLYSRVMTFAECQKMNLSADPELLTLCTTVPPDERPIDQAYIWTPVSPLDRFPPTKFSPLPNSLAQRFAVKAVEAQPLDYVNAVFDDTWKSFSWSRSVFPNAATYDEYLFGYHPIQVPSSPIGRYPNRATDYLRGGDPLTRIVSPYAGVIRVYQRYVWLPGTVYGLILLAGLAGIAWRWRRGGRDAILPWAASVILILVPAATAEFDYRYVTTAVPFGCLALALAFGRGLRNGRASGDGGSVISGSVISGSAIEAGAVSGSAVSAGTVPAGLTGPAGSAGGEASSAPGLPGDVASGRLRGGSANAGHHKRDLPADAN